MHASKYDYIRRNCSKKISYITKTKKTLAHLNTLYSPQLYHNIAYRIIKVTIATSASI